MIREKEVCKGNWEGSKTLEDEIQDGDCVETQVGKGFMEEKVLYLIKQKLQRSQITFDWKKTSSFCQLGDLGILKNYILSHHFMANRWGNSGNSGWLYFSGLQNHCRWWLQPWNKKILAPWKKSHDHPNSILKSRDINLPTKVCLLTAMVFPEITCGCESWTIKKAEHRRTDAFELWCWRRLLRVPWIARISNQSILKEINPEYSLEGLMLKLKLQYFGHLMWWAYSLEKTLMLGMIEGRGRRGWQRMRWLDGISWVWAKSGSWWWTGKPSVLQSMGSQRVGHNWATELNWFCLLNSLSPTHTLTHGWRE